MKRKDMEVTYTFGKGGGNPRNVRKRSIALKGDVECRIDQNRESMGRYHPQA